MDYHPGVAKQRVEPETVRLRDRQQRERRQLDENKQEKQIDQREDGHRPILVLPATRNYQVAKKRVEKEPEEVGTFLAAPKSGDDIEQRLGTLRIFINILKRVIM